MEVGLIFQVSLEIRPFQEITVFMRVNIGLMKLFVTIVTGLFNFFTGKVLPMLD